MDLRDYREKIDGIDSQLVDLFKERMSVAKDIALYKKANHINVYDAAREREKINSVRDQSGDELSSFASVLYTTLMELSKAYQNSILRETSPLGEEIEKALAETPKLFPEQAVIACQGIEGAYSQIAASRLFPFPNIMFFNSFETVFSAVSNGLCRYGILPLENSTTGSVNKVYDLMSKYNFKIVRSVRIKVDHNLLAKKGTKISDIKEIYSHEQAISQCSEFLKTLPGVKVTAVENTAVAARMVSQSERDDVAALSSRACADIYSLEILRDSVQDKGSNYTRFICISKDLEIYPGADCTSVMLTVPHKAGALYRVMARINALGVNLMKLESRPIPDSNFEFKFYFDLNTSVYSDKFIQLMGELEEQCETFAYLGSYSEVI